MDLVQLQPAHKHPLSLVAGESECNACSLHTKADHYYHCSTCKVSFHKECAEYSLVLTSHPYHPRHPLKIRTREFAEVVEVCLWCKGKMGYIFYHCSICDLNIHLFCASETQLILTLDPGENHDHPLTIIPRKMNFTCNLCGFYGDWFPIYACIQCDFMVHKDCLDLPNVIRRSCHEHRITRRLSLPLEKWSCGVCHTLVDSRYGAYSCSTEDCSYVVHTRCAIWDISCEERELEGVPEELDELKDVHPYEEVDGDNIIKHFSHEHQLRLILNGNGNGFVDKTRCCEACSIPIQCDNFYRCDSHNKCGFTLHQKCANFPRRRWSQLHPHPLTLKADDITFNYNSRRGFYFCTTCTRFACGFRYVCEEEACRFVVDVRCASISEPTNHKTHPHPLFTDLRNRGEMACGSCGKASSIVLYCLQCPFSICFKCATLPEKFVYLFDGHEQALTLCGGEVEEDVKGQYWCYICERKLDSKQWFYIDDHSGATLHTTCVFGSSPYAKIGRGMINDGSSESEFEIIPNNLRPLCCKCDRRCPDAVAFKQEDNIYCSSDCLSIEKLDYDCNFFYSGEKNES